MGTCMVQEGLIWLVMGPMGSLHIEFLVWNVCLLLTNRWKEQFFSAIRDRPLPKEIACGLGWLSLPNTESDSYSESEPRSCGSLNKVESHFNCHVDP